MWLHVYENHLLAELFKFIVTKLDQLATIHEMEGTVIPPNSRFLGLRKTRNREFGCKVKVPRVWRSLEVKSSDRNRELENFASLEPRICEVLLYGEKHRVWRKKDGDT